MYVRLLTQHMREEHGLPFERPRSPMRGPPPAEARLLARARATWHDFMRKVPPRWRKYAHGLDFSTLHRGGVPSCTRVLCRACQTRQAVCTFRYNACPVLNVYTKPHNAKGVTRAYHVPQTKWLATIFKRKRHQYDQKSYDRQRWVRRAVTPCTLR